MTCVMSGETNFHIWHNSELAKIKARDAESSSSLINTLSGNASASSLQVENCYLCSNLIVSRPGGTELDVSMVELPYKLQTQKTRTFGEKFCVSNRPTRCCTVYGS